MKPVCPKCCRFFRPKRNGVQVAEQRPLEMTSSPPGRRSPGSWTDYKLWQADLWECPDCGAQIITGFAPAPYAEHHEPGFLLEKKRALEGGHLYGVNDC